MLLTLNTYATFTYTFMLYRLHHTMDVNGFIETGEVIGEQATS